MDVILGISKPKIDSG